MTDVEALQRTVRRCTAVLVVLLSLVVAGTQMALPSVLAPLVFGTFVAALGYLAVSFLAAADRTTADAPGETDA
jgi:hypothetical protein